MGKSDEAGNKNQLIGGEEMRRKKVKRLGWLGILIVLIPSGLPSVKAQKVEVRLIDHEIFVKDASGTLRQLTRDGVPKENVTVSPALRKIAYNYTWTAYGFEAKPPVFIVLDLKTGEVIGKIEVSWVARYISKVEWVDERFLMVVGEHIFIVLLDVEEGKQTHFLYGGRFTLSPDRRKIVFLKGRLPLYGYIPPEYESDEIMLTIVGPRVSARGINSTARVVYPELRPWGDIEDRRYEDLNERHQMRGGLFWSPDSRKVAFVEEQRQVFWLVVLELDVKDAEVKAVPRRFKLAEELAEVRGIEWMKDNRAIHVVTQEGTYFVDLERGTVSVQ